MLMAMLAVLMLVVMVMTGMVVLIVRRVRSEQRSDPCPEHGCSQNTND
jgi:hypothetical protein